MGMELGCVSLTGIERDHPVRCSIWLVTLEYARDNGGEAQVYLNRCGASRFIAGV